MQKTDSGRLSLAKVYGPKGVKVISGKELRSIFGLKSTLVSFDIIPKLVNVNKDNKFSYMYDEGLNLTDKEFLLEPNKDNIFYLKPPKIINNNVLLVKGSGAGHGVGLSQWGAKNMAERGASYRRILRHFYKGVEITTFSRQLIFTLFVSQYH